MKQNLFKYPKLMKIVWNKILFFIIIDIEKFRKFACYDDYIDKIFFFREIHIEHTVVNNFEALSSKKIKLTTTSGNRVMKICRRSFIMIQHFFQ